MTRHVASPKRPMVRVFDGLMAASKRGLSDLSRDLKNTAYDYMTDKVKAAHSAGSAGKGDARTGPQRVYDLQYAVSELEKGEQQVSMQAADFDLAAAILAGQDPETWHTEDAFGIIESAKMIAEFAAEQKRAVPEHDLSEVDDLAATCTEVARKLRNDVSVCQSRRVKIAEYLGHLVLKVLCDPSISNLDFNDIARNTEKGRDIFADFEITPRDFVDEFKAAAKEVKYFSDEPGSLGLKCVRMKDGQLLNRVEFMQLRYREAMRLVPQQARAAKEAAEVERRSANKRSAREDIKQRLSGVWR